METAGKPARDNAATVANHWRVEGRGQGGAYQQVSDGVPALASEPGG